MTVDLRLLHYSPIPDFRRAGRVQDESPDTDLLRQIEDEISAAARHSAGRRYQEAIAAYRRATGLIWTEIDPAAHPRAGTAPPPSRARFRPLLEASLGWLSLLPVPAPVSPVAPSTPDGVGHLAADRVGLVARAVSSPASLAAASRARLAGILSKQGSIDAGRAAGAGAAGLDPAATRTHASGRAVLPPRASAATAATRAMVGSPRDPSRQRRRIGARARRGTGADAAHRYRATYRPRGPDRPGRRAVGYARHDPAGIADPAAPPRSERRRARHGPGTRGVVRLHGRLDPRSGRDRAPCLRVPGAQRRNAGHPGATAAGDR